MNELIKYENNLAILDKETASKIAEFERQAKYIKEQEDALKALILEEMQSKNIYKLDTGEMTITYVSATTKETFDSKEFRNAHADLYDEFVKISPVKASIRIKVK